MELLNKKEVSSDIVKIIHTKNYDFSQYEHRGIKLFDTFRAGDSFTGAFAAALAQGMPIEEALNFSSKVAFLSVCKLGANPSMPT